MTNSTEGTANRDKVAVPVFTIFFLLVYEALPYQFRLFSEYKLNKSDVYTLGVSILYY